MGIHSDASGYIVASGDTDIYAQNWAPKPHYPLCGFLALVKQRMSPTLNLKVMHWAIWSSRELLALAVYLCGC